MRAILSVTGFQYPLTEDAVVDKLRLWKVLPDAGSLGRGRRRLGTVLAAAHDARAAADAAVAAASKTRITFALTCCASSLSFHSRCGSFVIRQTDASPSVRWRAAAEDVASAMVRRGVMGAVMRPLREQLCDGKAVEGADAAGELASRCCTARASARRSISRG